jgi:transposase
MADFRHSGRRPQFYTPNFLEDQLMSEIMMVGLDLAKNVFQLHGVDQYGHQRLARQVKRPQLMSAIAQLPRCTIAMEACAGAHHWARRMGELGHTIKIISPQFVKPYVKGNKTDRNDAAAICEAAGRPDMRFVPVKSVDQQQILVFHRVRQLLIRQRTQVGNQVRGLLAEFGIAIPIGLASLRRRLPQILEDAENDVPALVRPVLADQYEALRALDERLKSLNKQLEYIARQSEPCQRLMGHLGVGTLVATCFVASVGAPQAFKNGRQVAAWVGLVPRQHSSGGKPTLLGISKRGDRYLRTLLIHGARSALKVAARHDDPVSRWALGVQTRRGVHRATVALANKMARRMWAELAYGPFAA